MRAFILLMLLMPTLAHAEQEDVWHSETHFGFAVHDQSTTRFKGADGSLVFLDLTRTLRPNFALGMRTAMIGAGSKGRSFYRLGAGPVLTWAWAEHWSLVGNLGYFRESASNSQRETLYESRGWMGVLGWERLFPISPRAALIWGGFVAFHDGSANNKGRARGIEIALRVAL